METSSPKTKTLLTGDRAFLEPSVLFQHLPDATAELAVPGRNNRRNGCWNYCQKQKMGLMGAISHGAHLCWMKACSSCGFSLQSL